jgi:hypothetical protein
MTPRLGKDLAGSANMTAQIARILAISPAARRPDCAADSRVIKRMRTENPVFGHLPALGQTVICLG